MRAGLPCETDHLAHLAEEIGILVSPRRKIAALLAENLVPACGFVLFDVRNLIEDVGHLLAVHERDAHHPAEISQHGPWL